MEIEENCYNNVAQFFELFQATLQKSYYNLSSKITFNVLWSDNSIKLSFNLVEKNWKPIWLTIKSLVWKNFPFSWGVYLWDSYFGKIKEQEGSAFVQ